jgi:hypothetical protein
MCSFQVGVVLYFGAISLDVVDYVLVLLAADTGTIVNTIIKVFANVDFNDFWRVFILALRMALRFSRSECLSD